MSLREYSIKAKALAVLLPWKTLRAPSVMGLKDGSLLSTIGYRGPDLNSAMAATLVTQAAKLNNCYKRFHGEWGLWIEARRREVRTYPHVVMRHPLAQAVYAERAADFTQPGKYFVTETFVTLSYTMPQKTSKWGQRFLYTNMPARSKSQDAHESFFVEECQRTRGMMKSCEPEAEVLEHEAFLTYLHSTVNPVPQRVRVPQNTAYMDAYLGSRYDLSTGIYPQLGPWSIRCVSLFDFPEESFPGMCDVLNTLPLEYRAVWRYLPMDRARASTEIGKYRHSHHGQRHDARSQLKAKAGKKVEALSMVAADDYQREAAEFQAEVEHNRVSAGPLTITIVVWGKTLEESQYKGERVTDALNTQGFVAKLEDEHPVFKLNTMDAWLGTIPGERKANPRQYLMHSMNLVHMAPSTAPWRGEEWNAHLDGPCVFKAVSDGQTPVNIHLHRNDVAHTGIIGSTGDGKSTLANLLCLFYTQYAAGKARIRIFDKGRAAWPLSYMMGGAWYDLGSMPMQPLAHLDQDYEISWAIDWLDGILQMEGMPLKPVMKTELFEAMTEIATWDSNKRTMTELVRLLDRRPLKEALSLYTCDGPYGKLFDGATTTIQSNPWQCFEMKHILETPRLLNAQLPVLFHQLESEMNGTPELWVVHEGWIALDTPYWESRARGWLKGFRVRNGAFVFLSQDLADPVDSKIMPAFLDNVVNWICTPNDMACEEKMGAYYQTIGLNMRQRQIIRDGTKKRDYYLIQKGGQTMIDLKLGPLALAACRTPDEDEWPAIQEQMDTNPEGFTEWYLGRKL